MHTPTPSPAIVSRAGLRALIALQALTLIAVVASRPSIPEAQAVGMQLERSDRSTLPNAAEQRREQIELLSLIAQQMRDSDERANKGGEASAEVLRSIDQQLGTVIESLAELRGEVRQSNTTRPAAQ